mgnify:CR=1 FL=1
MTVPPKPPGPIPVLLIFSSINCAKQNANPCKDVFIVKCALIPFFIINFVFCIVGVSAALNPFLFLAIPVIIFIEVIHTYILTISTGIPSVLYSIKAIIKDKNKNRGLIITGIILSFFFCIDAIGALLLYLGSRKIEKNQ